MIFELECQRPFFVALGRLSTESGLCKNNDFGQVIQTLHANSYKNITPEKKKKKREIYLSAGFQYFLRNPFIIFGNI